MFLQKTTSCVSSENNEDSYKMSVSNEFFFFFFCWGVGGLYPEIWR